MHSPDMQADEVVEKVVQRIQEGARRCVAPCHNEVVSISPCQKSNEQQIAGWFLLVLLVSMPVLTLGALLN